MSERENELEALTPCDDLEVERAFALVLVPETLVVEEEGQVGLAAGVHGLARELGWCIGVSGDREIGVGYLDVARRLRVGAHEEPCALFPRLGDPHVDPRAPDGAPLALALAHLPGGERPRRRGGRERRDGREDEPDTLGDLAPAPFVRRGLAPRVA